MIQNNKRLLTPGEYFDSHNGVYNFGYVIRLAMEFGFQLNDEDVEHFKTSNALEITDDMFKDYEHVHELVSEAETFLSNNSCPEGYYFGNTENGDWGVWKIEEEQA